MADNKWIDLQNGELILFLHQHLPFLQAKTHHEFNGLGHFLQLLDHLITNKFADNGSPFLEVRISKKEFQSFGTGKYYQKFIDTFFIPDPNYFYSGEAYQKPKKHITFMFMQKFMLDVQSALRGKLGDDAYFKPLKINLNNPKKVKAFSIPFESSKLLDKPFWDSFKRYVGIQNPPINIIDEIATSSVLLTNKKDLEYYTHGLSDRQIRALPVDKPLYTFEVKRLNKSEQFKPKFPTAKKLKDDINTQIKINNKALDQMIAEAKGFESNQLRAIKRFYGNNDNYLFYGEANHRLYATADLNTAPLLQGLPKEIRNKLFKDFYQYDLTAAAPTILYQLFQKHCKGKKLNALEAYIANRNTLRALSANYLLTNDKDHYKDFNHAKTNVKEVITAIFYGGNPLNKRSEVQMSYTNRVALMANLAEFKALAEEAKKMFNELYKAISKILIKMAIFYMTKLQ